MVNENKHCSDNHEYQAIFDSLINGKNPSLRYHDNFELVNNLVTIIVNNMNFYGDKPYLLNTINILSKLYDYRYIAEYLYAQKVKKREILNIFEDLAKSDTPSDYKKLIHKFFYLKFMNKIITLSFSDVPFTFCLHDIFKNENQNQILVYINDMYYESCLIDLFNNVGINLTTFIDQQYDIPGTNALVRNGIVKYWILPDGKEVVSKKNNIKNPQKFQKEQINYEIISKKIGQGLNINLKNDANSKEKVFLKIVRPFAVIKDCYSNVYYALSTFIKGISLEDLLINESKQIIRDYYLKHYSLILDALYDHGIIWGDMCLRNILVEKIENIVNYYIFDFEKTSFTSNKVPMNKRKEHCRGQIFSEELCTICNLDEIEKNLKNHFNTKDWDLTSKKPIDFCKRQEVTDIFNIQDISTVGNYNRSDLKIIKARQPYINRSTNKYEFPGHLGFKVEHYLGCLDYSDAKDYENKITEILIFSKKYDCFFEVVSLIKTIVDKLEGSFLKSEFENILTGKEPMIYSAFSYNTAKHLVNVINSFLKLKYKKESFLKLLNNIKEGWCKNK